MTNIKAIIVDDEKNSRIVLKTLLNNCCKDINVIGEAKNVEEAYTLIKDLKPDLIFLDIQMPTGNGFKLLEKFEKIPFDVIFVTSYDQYAINAIKFSALDYLLKPVDVELLKQAAVKAIEKFEKKTGSHLQVVNLIQSVDPNVIEKKIALHSHDIVRYIKLSDIIYIEGDGHYSVVHTMQQEKFSSARTLKEFEEYFENYDFFVRVHKGVIINVHHIHHYSKGDPFIIEMSNGASFEASRRKKVEVLERLKK